MTDNAYQLLLERLAGVDGDGAPTPSLGERVEQLGQGDPQLALLAKVLARQAQAAAAAEEAPPGDPEEPERAEAQASANLGDLVGAVYDELEMLRRRNDALAAALGACYLCWGEDTACPVCRGRGGPGARRPETAAYAHYVTPAVRSLHAFERRTPRPPPTEAEDPDPPEERSEA